MRHDLILLKPRSHSMNVSRNRTVLTLDDDGMIRNHGPSGLFFHETRVLSHYELFHDGEPFRPASMSNVDQNTWLGYYVITPVKHRKRQGPELWDEETQEVVELRVSRFINDGMHEDLDFTNYCREKVKFRFEVKLNADFADLEETISRRVQHGKLWKRWNAKPKSISVRYDYHAQHKYHHQDAFGCAKFKRGTEILFHEFTTPGRHVGRGVRFEIELKPGETWHACVDFIPIKDGERFRPSCQCRSFGLSGCELDKVDTHFLESATNFIYQPKENLGAIVEIALDQAKKDLNALRLHDFDGTDGGWTVAAGLPMYVALFGRDTLTASWQTAMVDVNLMRGTLEELAKYQGTTDSPWRDERVGKMIHEAHTGPVDLLRFTPRERYYGSSTTSAFYPFVVSQLWHWTGDKALVRKYLAPALKALDWVDNHGDLDGDGFYEYKTRSCQGLENQGWKDSGDAMVYEDGAIAHAPIGTCEEQAYVYVSKLHFSELLWWLGEKELAKKLFHDASELKKRFNDAYWMPDENFFAMALDGKKRPLKSIASNPGHCLATGIVDKALALPTAERLMRPDLFSGWGVRTLSSQHPAFNPYAYHRGTVWPVENSTFTLGFARYDLTEHLHTLARAQIEACALFDFYRLPELFAGHQRDADHPFPGLYPRACYPQAWSSSAIFSFVQSLVGLYPYAPLHLLIVDPHLPAWLPHLTLQNLRVGKAKVTIRFYRKANGESSYEVIEQKGKLHILHQPSPWSLTATKTERFKDLVMSF